MGRFNAYYFGNLRKGRFESIINIADELDFLSKNAKLYIYGNCTNEQKQIMSLKRNVIFLGFDNLENIFNKIKRDCDLLIHTEPFDNFSKIDLIDAFSTKIVDCLATGLPFLVYTPKELNLY